MITVQLTGGLGNQLFQFAAAKALSIHHNVELALEVSSFYREELPDLEVPRNFEMYHFNGVAEKIINANKSLLEFHFLKERKIEKLLPNYKRRVYKEPHYHYDKKFFNASNNVFLKGGWQSPLYFLSIEEKLKEILTIKSSLINEVASLAEQFQNTNTLAIHVRRGDYLRKPIILNWHGVLGKDYYVKAFNTIRSKTTIDRVLYFSDDTDWVTEKLLPEIPGEIISNTVATSQYHDFYLMQHCKHNIIANSSFSWWAAYLNPNPNKIVVAPERWFNKAPLNTKDLYPQGWLKI